MPKITILYDNRKDNHTLQEGWGFSSLIEWDGRKILFDTGANLEAFFANSEKLQIAYDAITHVVFSHKHSDHRTGFEEILKRLPPQIPIYLPKTFPNALIKKVPSQMPVQKMKSFQEIDTNIFSLVLRGGLFLYEQCLVLKTPKGLVILTGCAHPGIVHIIQETQKRFNDKIHLVLGGFHLFRNSKESVASIIEEFKRLGVEKVAPCHCCGDHPIQAFKESYKDDFIKIGTGTIFTI